jgi:D-alanyl-D-alanine carboxypeptidase/D-alanyl-D-alanine-endopeptidase (penicillin-binding protein 4)
LKNLLFGFLSIIFLNACSVQKKFTKALPLTHHHHQGFLFIDLASGDTLFQKNADKYFVPASTTKLFTLYSATHFLKDSLLAFQYHESNDTLYVKGTFDPTYNHPDFKLEYLPFTKGKPVILDNSVYTGPEYGKGWMWDDAADHYQVSLSAFPVYRQQIEVEKTLNGLKFYPELFEKQEFSLDELIPLGKSSAIEELTVGQKVSFPMKLNNDLLAQILTHDLKSNVSVGKAPKMAFYENQNSVSLDSALMYMMHRSDNFFAEQLLLQSGLKMFADSIDTGRIIGRLLENELKGLPQKPRWVDGSGLSRYNLFSPADLTTVISLMENDLGFERLKTLLPANGLNGTMKTFAAEEEPFIFAKSGSMSGVYNLAGFLKTDKGRLLLFAVMNNNFTQSLSKTRAETADFLIEVKSRF